MGNTDSNKSNAAGSSEEDSARRQRENAETAVGAATDEAAVAAAKLLSSSASEDEKTNERGKMMESAGSSRGGYQIPRNKFEDSPPYDYYPDHEKTNEAAGRFESHQIPGIKFGNFPSGSVVLEGAAGTDNRITGLVLDVTTMTDKKIEALTAKVNELAESVAALTTIVHSLQGNPPQAPPPSARWTEEAVAALTTIVHSLQGNPPQAPPPFARWTEEAVQAEIHFDKERQGRTMMNLQPQHMEQVEEEITQPKKNLPNHIVVTKASSTIFPLNPSQHTPAYQNPTSKNLQRRALRHCRNLNSSPSEALATLVEQGLLEPLETQSPRPPFGPYYDPTKHCAYHQISGHETDHCIQLQRDIQELIDQGVF